MQLYGSHGASQIFNLFTPSHVLMAGMCVHARCRLHHVEQPECQRRSQRSRVELFGDTLTHALFTLTAQDFYLWQSIKYGILPFLLDTYLSFLSLSSSGDVFMSQVWKCMEAQSGHGCYYLFHSVVSRLLYLFSLLSHDNGINYCVFTK